MPILNTFGVTMKW